jgi:putative nucleotidyltransferase with HDIG domain
MKAQQEKTNVTLKGNLDINELIHEYRVAMLSVKIAKSTGLGDEIIMDLYTAAIFHDIGKCMIDKQILNKPGPLTVREKEIVKKHVEYGAKIGILMNLSQDSIKYILGHHENYDGSGYPTGAKAENIPIGARIIKICDVYDALRMDRAYRPAFPLIKALGIMENEKHVFDPAFYEIFKVVVAFEDE